MRLPRSYAGLWHLNMGDKASGPFHDANFAMKLASSACIYCTSSYKNNSEPAASARCAFLQNLECRQCFAFQHFQKRTAAGRNVVNLLFDAVFGNSGQRVAAAGQ